MASLTGEHYADVWAFMATAERVWATVGCDDCGWRRNVEGETAQEVEAQVAAAIAQHNGRN